MINEKGKAFGVYALHVSKQYATGYIEEWHIYRRYSDFYDLHNKIKDRVSNKLQITQRIIWFNLSLIYFQFPDLSKLTFPGKKTFHNTDRAVLERRMRMLGSYMHTLCKDSIINTHGGLKALLMTFLEQGEYDRANSGGPISHTVCEQLIMSLSNNIYYRILECHKILKEYCLFSKTYLSKR